MKRLLLLFIALLCTNSALYSNPQTSEHQHTEILFSQEGVDQLITYLAQGNTVKNIVALNDLTSVGDITFVARAVALMCAAGLTVEKSKMENLLKVENKFTELLATLTALTELGVAPYSASKEQEDDTMQNVRQEVKQLKKAITRIRQVIGICVPENIDETVNYALDIVRTAEVSIETKKAFIERIKQAHNSEKIDARCNCVLAKL